MGIRSFIRSIMGIKNNHKFMYTNSPDIGVIDRSNQAVKICVKYKILPLYNKQTNSFDVNVFVSDKNIHLIEEFYSDLDESELEYEGELDKGAVNRIVCKIFI